MSEYISETKEHEIRERVRDGINNILNNNVLDVWELKDKLHKEIASTDLIEAAGGRSTLEAQLEACEDKLGWSEMENSILKDRLTQYEAMMPAMTYRMIQTEEALKQSAVEKIAFETQIKCLESRLAWDEKLLKQGSEIYDKSKVIVENKEINLDVLLDRHDRDFIHNLYVAVLSREPNADEENVYLKPLREQSLTRLELVYIIRFSEEGKKNGVHIHSLRKRYIIFKFANFMYRIPLLGRLIKITRLLFGLPNVYRQLSGIELEMYRERKKRKSNTANIEKITWELNAVKRKQKETDVALDDVIDEMRNALKAIILNYKKIL